MTLFITCKHGIYSYVLETNHVSRVYSVGPVLYLQFVLHLMLRVGVGGGSERQYSYYACYYIITFIIIIITRGNHAI